MNQELEDLREEAIGLGVEFKKTHGVKTIKKLIKEFKDKDEVYSSSTSNEGTEVVAEQKEEVKPKLKEKKYAYRELKLANEIYPADGLSPIKKATRLIRLRVTNRDPDEQWKKSETVKVSTANFGTLCSRQITFGIIEHIEYVGLVSLLEKKYVHKTQKQNKQTGEFYIENDLRPSLSIDILEPITEAEKVTIGTRQLTSLNED